MYKRFTIDGSADLEMRLVGMCERVVAAVTEIIPKRKLEAIVLGGGYGRGEGGVLTTDTGEQPYNDLEFYVFMRGSRLANDRKYREALDALGHKLSPTEWLHVEFKVDCVRRLRHAPVSMFSYDLVSGHRVVFGDEEVLSRCKKHLDATVIPLHEATRLLFNRCTGLLFAKNFLRTGLNAEKADFVGRNLAKAQLALGDIVLTALGKYNWSVRERAIRLAKLEGNDFPLPLAELQRQHALGAEFKLHPKRIEKTVEGFAHEFDYVSSCARRLWLWLEARRLKRPFANVRDYATSSNNKCPETSTLKNLLVNARTFGLSGMSTRYPRERLLHALVLLLWKNEALGEHRLRMYVQSELRTTETSMPKLVEAYEQIWRRFN